MELPLDIFQLVGVTLGAEPREVLDMLEKRLGSFEYPGISSETRKKRDELLKRLSDILIDPEKRVEYEKIVRGSTKENRTNVGLNVGEEAAGMLLLLEAGEASDVICIGKEYCRKSVSSELSLTKNDQDLFLIVDYATLDLAKELESKRYYEKAANILMERIGVRRYTNASDSLERKMVYQLEELLPYRVLDLLSRPTEVENQRKQGIEYLELLVRNRGGLENESQKYMDDRGFQAFFRQIREYLSVQEQNDMFERWYRDGSKAAGFLLAITLVACGFAQRKPEKINHALKIIKEIDSSDLVPIEANIYLLLGDVKSAKRIYAKIDNELKKWIQGTSQDELGQMCAWCEEWLRRDVLQGYSNLESDASIDGYFSDRDVLHYIENEYDNVSNESTRKDRYILDRERFLSTGVQKTKDYSKIQIGRKLYTDTLTKFKRSNQSKDWYHDFLEIAPIVVTVTGIGSLIFFAQLNKNTYSSDKSINTQTVKQVQEKIEKRGYEKPTLGELRGILDKWLQIKASVLAGNRVPLEAQNVASESLVSKLKSQRVSDMRENQYQKIEVDILRLSTLRMEERLIEVMAELKYSDKRMDGRGNILDKTDKHVFKRKYTFIYNGSRWVVS